MKKRKHLRIFISLLTILCFISLCPLKVMAIQTLPTKVSDENSSLANTPAELDTVPPIIQDAKAVRISQNLAELAFDINEVSWIFLKTVPQGTGFSLSKELINAEYDIVFLTTQGQQSQLPIVLHTTDAMDICIVGVDYDKNVSAVSVMQIAAYEVTQTQVETLRDESTNQQEESHEELQIENLQESVAISPIIPPYEKNEPAPPAKLNDTTEDQSDTKNIIDLPLSLPEALVLGTIFAFAGAGLFFVPPVINKFL